MKHKITLQALLRGLFTVVLAIMAAGGTMGQPAQKTVRGVVRDEAGVAISGATVTVSGTSLGSVTNSTGEFEIRMPSSVSTVQVSFIGYKPVWVELGDLLNIEVTLESDVINIADVVVLGYGVVRKQDLTGSVSVLATEDKLETQPISSIDQFMQGRMAGVSITSNSGAPGAGMNIHIRGISTLSGDTAPLYVIDGFPVEAATARSGGTVNELNQQPNMNPLASINPNDIESTQVLKDASATAIYGSRATNGVVIINTKRGREGSVKINFNSRVDVSQIARKYDVLNAYEYGLYENELDNTSGGWDMNGQINVPTTAPRNDDAQLALYQQYSTDWQDLMYRTGISTDQQLSISGGSKVSTFNITGGYTKNNGIILNTGLERYSFRVNYTHDLTERLNMNVNMSYSRSVQNQTTHSQASTINSMVKRILTNKPTLSPTSVDTEETGLEEVVADNPYIMATELKDMLIQQHFLTNAAFTYRIFKGFSVKVAGNMNSLVGSRKSYHPIGTNAGNAYNGMAFRGENKRQNYVFESTLHYNDFIDKSQNHRIDAVAGWTFESRNNENLAILASNFPGNDLEYNTIGEALVTSDKNSSIETRKLSSFLGRVNYSLMNRYIFTLTGRYDGSSLLAEGNQWKFFPSGAFAWRISEEGFLKDVHVLSDLKLRASLGATGNQNIGYAAPYAIMNNVRVPANGVAVSGKRPSSPANFNLGWENTVSANIGVDVGFVGNRYRMSVDIYKRVTKDLLLNFTLPISSGYGSIPMNMGQISNKGIEIEAYADIVTKTAVKWSVNANWYLNRNMVDDIGGNTIQGQTYLAGAGTLNQSLHRTMKGYPVGSFYGYVVDGVYQNTEEALLAPIDSPQATPGSLRFLDIGGPDGVPDGRITADDMTILGTSQPDFNYGFGTDVSWKGLKLSLQFNGSYGAKVANLNRFLLDGFTSLNSNISRAAWYGRWRGEGTSNFYPKVDGSNASVFFYQRFSNMFIEDASYFRLKNLTLNYTFSFEKSNAIKSLGVFFTATNLFTITDYSGYDPEVSISAGALSPNVDYAAYPSSKTYSFGINLGF